MQELTKRTIQNLLLQTSHVLDVEDFELVEQLDKLAERVVDPLDIENSTILSAPFRIGKDTIYPVSIGKAKYIDEVLRGWYAENDDSFFIAVGWALRYDSVTLWSKGTDERETKKFIKRFWRRCGWRADELESLILWAFGDGGEGDSTKANYGAVIGLLCSEYGSTPDYWIHEASASLVSTMLNDWQRKQEEEKDQIKKQAAKNKQTLNLGVSLKGIATAKFKAKENEILELWQRTM